jgi:anti-sigma regulatory factor (Ser/Thr protein kinase)
MKSATTLRPRGRAAWTLPGMPASVRVFRGLARAAAAGNDDQAEAAALCVTELVTNALLHTRSGLPGGNVTVRFEASPSKPGLRISVHDDGPRVVASSTAARAGTLPGPAETGRGLGIVAAVAAEHGVIRTARGSITWCIIPAAVRHDR